MRLVIQRVKKARVLIAEQPYAEIQRGFLVFVGIHRNDTSKDIEYCLAKMLNLRAFDTETRNTDASILQLSGEVLVISQFTLYGDCRKGRRPSFSEAMTPEAAREIYSSFIERARSFITVREGLFQASMDIELINDGPFTLLIDSTKQF